MEDFNRAVTYIVLHDNFLSLDNPYPEKGHVLTIILNEKTLQETVVTASGQQVLRTVIVQTAFEMNYKNGLWRKLQIKRPINA